MAYSPIEQRYIDMVVEGYFPTMPTEPAPAAEEASLEGVQLAAGPSKTRTDAPAGAGLPKAPTTPDEAAELMRRMPLATQSEMIMRRIAEDQKAGVVGAVIPKDMTLREKLAAGMQQMLIDNAGMDNARARRLAQTMFGGESSGAPLGIGLIDITPAVIPLATEEAGISAGEAREAALAGDYGTAALKYGTGVLQGLDVVPGVAMAKAGAKAVGKALEPVAGEMLESYLTKTGAILKMAPDSPGIEVPAAPKPSTPAFKKWFGDSKVVDDKGAPLVMYHGTPRDFEQFKRNAGYDEAIFVSPDPKFAGSFAGAEYTIATGGTPNVIPLYVRASNPFDFDNPTQRAMVIDLAIQEEPLYRTSTDQEGMRRVLNDALTDKKANWSTLEGAGFQKAIKALGFDSFYVREEGIKNLAVYNPEQLKSVFNKGTFDPKDPRILYSGGAAGTSTMQDEEKK